MHPCENDKSETYASRWNGRILKPGLTGEPLDEAYCQMFEWSAEMVKRVEGVPEDEIDSAIDEAVEFVRHNR
jgi:hypothetical protein